MIRISVRVFAAIAALLVLSNCSSTKVMIEWQAGHDEISKRDRVAVAAMMPEALQRLTVEQEIVRVMRKGGRNALASSDIPGLAGGLSRTTAEPALKAASVDALIVVFFTSGGKGEDLGHTEYYSSKVDSDFFKPGYRWFVPQFINVDTTREGAEFFAQKNYVYVESNYFDIVDDRAKWSMITRSKEPQYSDAAKSVAKEIVAKMKSTGIL